MNFFSNGSVVGVIITSWVFALLLVFVLADIVMISISRIEIIHKLIIFFRIKSKLKKIIPHWWEIKEIGIVTMSKTEDNKIEVYVKVQSKIYSFTHGHIKNNKYNPAWTNDFIEVDRFGNIIKTKLIEEIAYYDKQYKVDTKQLLRDKALENLGINI